MQSAVFLLTENVGVATGLLSMHLYHIVSPRKVMSSPQGRGYRHIHFPKLSFFSSRWFLDIEKIVLLELKGVKKLGVIILSCLMVFIISFMLCSLKYL